METNVAGVTVFGEMLVSDSCCARVHTHCSLQTKARRYSDFGVPFKLRVWVCADHGTLPNAIAKGPGVFFFGTPLISCCWQTGVDSAGNKTYFLETDFCAESLPIAQTFAEKAFSEEAENFRGLLRRRYAELCLENTI